MKVPACTQETAAAHRAARGVGKQDHDTAPAELVEP